MVSRTMRAGMEAGLPRGGHDTERAITGAAVAVAVVAVAVAVAAEGSAAGAAVAAAPRPRKLYIWSVSEIQSERASQGVSKRGQVYVCGRGGGQNHKTRHGDSLLLSALLL